MAVRLGVFRSLDAIRPARLSVFADRVEVTRSYGRVVRTLRINYEALSSLQVVVTEGSTSVVMVDGQGVVHALAMPRSDAWRVRALIESVWKPRS
jgi:hypothetical protein